MITTKFLYKLYCRESWLLGSKGWQANADGVHGRTYALPGLNGLKRQLVIFKRTIPHNVPTCTCACIVWGQQYILPSLGLLCRDVTFTPFWHPTHLVVTLRMSWGLLTTPAWLQSSSDHKWTHRESHRDTVWKERNTMPIIHGGQMNTCVDTIGATHFGPLMHLTLNSWAPGRFKVNFSQ